MIEESLKDKSFATAVLQSIKEDLKDLSTLRVYGKHKM